MDTNDHLSAGSAFLSPAQALEVNKVHELEQLIDLFSKFRCRFECLETKFRRTLLQLQSELVSDVLRSACGSELERSPEDPSGEKSQRNTASFTGDSEWNELQRANRKALKVAILNARFLVKAFYRQFKSNLDEFRNWRSNVSTVNFSAVSVTAFSILVRKFIQDMMTGNLTCHISAM